MKRKAKFAVGQVVRYERGYFMIREQTFCRKGETIHLPGWHYRQEWTWIPECDLRALTTREIGPRKARKP